MNYLEQLKHPKWQRRRLEILQRADFRCESCNADDKTLHVHHKRYRAGAMAWEYGDDDLIALCEPCHQKQHGVQPAPSEPSIPRRVPSDDLMRHYLQTWGQQAYTTSCPLIAIAQCRACGNEVLCAAELEGSDIVVMSCSRGPKCETVRCGDKLPAVIVGYCEAWQVLL